MENKTRSGRSRLADLVVHIATIAVAAAALAYLGYHFFEGFSADIETEYATLVTDSDVVPLDAYIMRSESVIFAASATSGHSVGYVFSDGTKVHGGQVVANIYTGDGSSDEAIVDLDRRIDLLESSNLTDGMTSSDTYVIDSKIQNYYYLIHQSTLLGNYSNLTKRRGELLTLINKRRILTGVTTGYSDRIESLTAERALLSAGQDTIAESVEAPYAGYFYSTTDGYESTFSASKVESLTLAEFDKMLSSQPTRYSDRAVGKMVSDFARQSEVFHEGVFVLREFPVQRRYFNKDDTFERRERGWFRPCPAGPRDRTDTGGFQLPAHAAGRSCQVVLHGLPRADLGGETCRREAGRVYHDRKHD